MAWLHGHLTNGFLVDVVEARTAARCDEKIDTSYLRGSIVLIADLVLSNE